MGFRVLISRIIFMKLCRTHSYGKEIQQRQKLNFDPLVYRTFWLFGDEFSVSYDGFSDLVEYVSMDQGVFG